jgi:hypothetical protein
MTEPQTTETPTATGTFVLMGAGTYGGRWGKGATMALARAQFRREGGLLGKGYTVLEFPVGTVFVGVDQMGRATWHNPGLEPAQPTVTEVPARGRR